MTNGHKVVIIGNSGVGKSAVIDRILRDRFDEYNVSTIGAAFSIKKIAINEKIIELQIWDTAGQERFNSIVPMYLKKAHAVIMVYAINDEKSQEDLLTKWYPYVRDNDIKHIYVIGNKCDLAMTEADKKFSASLQKRFPKNYLTSAKLNIGISDLFTDIASDVYILNADPLPAILLEPFVPHKSTFCCW